MAINPLKIFGWVLLAAGLVLIAYSVKTSYSYFSGHSKFPPLVKDSAMPENNAAQSPVVNIDDAQAVSAMIQLQVQTSVNKAVGEMVPAGSVAELFNASIWTLFATMMIYAGAKISEIGAKLLSAKGAG